MYISHQGQQAIHQDIVNSALRRSEQRRLCKESEQWAGSAVNGGSEGLRLLHSVLVRLFAAVSTRAWTGVE
jgi:hypothetical protein